MVTPARPTRRRRGASTLGCLLAALLAVVVVYYAIDVGRVYWKYYKLVDEMESSARFAQEKSNEEIQQHLADVARDLELPREAQRFTIRRTEHPPVVSIRTEYRVTLELPFHNRVLTLKPNVEVRQ